ncbi:SDR family oxidoreductase [Aureibacter tunicatorum]|uniref:NAD(P)-dependent dehydrogenase (Short-subunit alcohol dehydrogenase family) n=1 Tax=Aureibacter tunicatorum TaxID=866807 RepID=A0AAE3XKQ1_9BACT|nr:SDR family oxidoreductase [Aureibacter tunicatorum]MDR6237526.1 NAD(P)-dependent dehydrogenase (short-subunit alcohol dehydrogenase family) [Aureibacter tunicatorum]BDD02560.1 short-chain dehydrogenase/reductase [Aureibacter tunicatorum]
MKRTVLITGTSTGIGKSAVKKFHAEGWNVIATMRNPEAGKELAQLDNVLVAELDVTKIETIESAIESGIEEFETIDVVINNAGYGTMGPLEGASEELMKHIFEVNVFGVARVTKAILPHMRGNNSGLIVNISSIVGRATFPYQALYHSTKHALEGLTEDLQYELRPLGIRVKLVEPGGVNTEFLNSIAYTEVDGIKEYEPGLEKYYKAIKNYTPEMLSTSEQIADVVFEASTDDSNTLRYLAGEDAKQTQQARSNMSDEEFYQMMKDQFKL